MIETIVIVEDESIIALMLQRFLSKLKYKVAGIAKEGQEAIELVKNSRPDLIIMDINIQGAMNGIETCKKIKEFHDVPVIFLTGNSLDSLNNEELCKDKIVIGKPVSMDEIGDAIKQLEVDRV